MTIAIALLVACLGTGIGVWAWTLRRGRGPVRRSLSSVAAGVGVAFGVAAAYMAGGEEPTLGLAAVVPVGLQLAVAVLETRCARTWQRVAGDLGFKTHKRGFAGERQGVLVHLEHPGSEAGTDRLGRRVLGRVLLVPAGPIHGVRLWAEAFGARIRGGSPDDVQTGDSRFDSRVHVRGEARVVMACMSSTARRLVLEAVAIDSMELDGERLRFTRPAWFVDDKEIREAVRLGAAVLRYVERARGSVPERLLANLASEQLVDVRLRLFELLLAEGDAWAARAQDLALKDRDVGIRRRALDSLNGDAWLDAVQRFIVDDRVDVDARVEELGRLLETRDVEALRPWLTETVGQASGRLRQVLLRALGIDPQALAGQVSLVAPGGGQVSLASDGGAVSVSPPPES